MTIKYHTEHTIKFPVFEESGETYVYSGEFREANNEPFLRSDMETLIGFGTTKKKVHVYKKKMWVASEGEPYFYIVYSITDGLFRVFSDRLSNVEDESVAKQIEKGNHYRTQFRAQTVADFLNRKFEKDILQVFKDSH